MVLADIPERQALRQVREDLNARRSQIADLDLGIENLRQDLHHFEGHYFARIQEEQDAFSRIKRVTGHAERWARLLYDSAKPKTAPKKNTRAHTRRTPQDFVTAARRLERQRQREADEGQIRRHEPAAVEPEEATPYKRQQRQSALKEAYRALARRYHPDLARTEEERLHASQWMRRINQLYRDADCERLVSLAEQAKGGDVEDESLSLQEQLGGLEERLAWFDLVMENLSEERRSLEDSPTCQLMRDVEAADTEGRDLVAEVKAELRAEVMHAYNNVREAIVNLEQRVRQFNRSRAPGNKLTRQDKQNLEATFDPFADKALIRRALGRSSEQQPTKIVADFEGWLIQQIQDQPELVCLALLTYVTELSPFPFEGLSDFRDLAARFADVVVTTLEDLAADRAEDENAAVRTEPGQGKSLEATMVAMEDLVEYGVKQANPEVAHLGLRFRSKPFALAIPLALRDLRIARVFRDVLEVTGKFTNCDACEEKIYAVPLYRLRGLDELHASICPNCGHTLESYFMPKGENVQAVLNPTFLEYELVSEWTFRLARASLAIQLVPAQVEAMTVGELKRRLVDDLFVRHDLEIPRGDVLLLQDEQRVAEKTPLHELTEQQFSVRFHERAEINETDALELIRHRIRNRFR